MSVNSSKNSADSTDGEREDEAQRRDKGSGKVARRLRALFCCVKQRESHERFVEYDDPDEYDYIVEKLVVKRVPHALFAIPRADLPYRRGSDASTTPAASVSRSISSAFDKRNDPVARGTSSTRTTVGSDAYCDFPANGVSRIDKNEDEGAPGRSVQHADLNKSGRPIKESPSFPRSGQSFVEEVISDVTSSTRTDVSSTVAPSLVLQEDVPIRDQFAYRGGSLFGFVRKHATSRVKESSKQSQAASTEKDRDYFVPGWKRKYIVSPLRIQRGSFNLRKPKSVIGNVEGKSLAYVEDAIENKTSELTEAAKDCGTPNTAVRWRVTIRPQRAKEPVTSEVRVGDTYE